MNAPGESGAVKGGVMAADDVSVAEFDASSGAESVRVRVGGVPILESAIAQEMQHHPALHPSKARADAVQALIVQELLRQEVVRCGGAGIASRHAYQTQEEADIDHLIASAIPRRRPDRAGCLQFHTRYPSRFREPDRIRLRHILLAAAPEDVVTQKHARMTADRLIVELMVNPASFSKLAERHSACPSRRDGGSLGWIERGQTTPEFERQVFRLGKGLAVSAVQSRWGWHVVHIDEKRPGAALSFDQCEERIGDFLELQAFQADIRSYVKMLIDRTGVQGWHGPSCDEGNGLAKGDVGKRWM